MPRFFATLLPAAAAALLIAAGAAEADSRLFSARSEAGDRTVVGATLDGAALPIAGQGGGVTFFRIDRPGDPVPCVNRITFTASDGALATIDANVCANGAEVTVNFAASATAAAPAAASVPATGNQPVTIAVDDPALRIDGVFMAGKPVALNRRIGNAVEVLVAPGPDGIDCNRDLGLLLSDGRRIARSVDICANDWQVMVALAGGGTTAAASPPPEPPVYPPAPGATAPAAEAAVWMFTSASDNGSLAFAVPNTDDSEFTAVCSPGSSEATIALGRSAPEVQPGASVSVGFAAGTFSRAYQATGSDVSQLSGLSNPLIALKTDDPLWQAIIRESYLVIQIGSAQPYSLSLKGSAAKARPFLAYCNPAPPVVAAPSIPDPGSGAIPFVCDSGEFIRVTFDDANDAVLVSAAGAPPLLLHRVASRQGARYVAAGAELVGYAEDITWSRSGGYPATCRPQ